MFINLISVYTIIGNDKGIITIEINISEDTTTQVMNRQPKDQDNIHILKR